MLRAMHIFETNAQQRSSLKDFAGAANLNFDKQFVQELANKMLTWYAHKMLRWYLPGDPNGVAAALSRWA